jgi:hypothetical protein
MPLIFLLLCTKIAHHSFCFQGEEDGQGKADVPDMDKSEWIKSEFLMDPDNSASK